MRALLPFKNKDFLLLFAEGLFVQLFQLFFLREIFVRCAGIELIPVLALSMLLASTAISCLFFSWLWRNTSMRYDLWRIFAMILLPLLALAALLIAAAAPELPGFKFFIYSFHLSQIFTIAILSVIPFGVINGIFYSAGFRCLDRCEAASAYSADSLGAAAGAFLFSIIFVFVFKSFSILAIAGILLGFCGVFSAFFVKNTDFSRLMVFLFFSLLLLASLASIHYEEKIFLLKNSLMGSCNVSTVETPSGRLEFRCPRGAKGDFGLPSEEISTVLFNDIQLPDLRPTDRSRISEWSFCFYSVLQSPRRSGMRVLLIDTPFSSLPATLSIMSATDRIDCLSSFAPGALAGLLRKSCGKTVFESVDARGFVEASEGRVYDMVLMRNLGNSNFLDNRLMTFEFFKELSRVMKPDGVLIWELGTLGADSFSGPVCGTLHKVFPEILFSRSIVAASKEKGILAADLKTLTARVPVSRGLCENENLFTGGVLDFMLARFEWNDFKYRQIQPVSGILNSDFSPVLPYRKFISDVFKNDLYKKLVTDYCYRFWYIPLLGIGACYVFLRFLFSRAVSGRSVFRSFENGFFGLAFCVLAMIVYQGRTGLFYNDMAIFFAMFMSGAFLGTHASNEYLHLKNVIMKLAMLLPAGLWGAIYLPLAFFQWILWALVFAAGLAAASSYVDCRERSFVDVSAELWAFELLGGACGVIFIIFYMFPAAGLCPSLLLLMLFRLPMFHVAQLNFDKSSR